MEVGFLGTGRMGKAMAANLLKAGHHVRAWDKATEPLRELERAGAEIAAVAKAVAMLDGARQDVGDRLDPAVRVPGEPGQVVLGPLVAEVVEQQERVEFTGGAEPECAAQVHTCALERGLRLRHPLHRAD